MCGGILHLCFSSIWLPISCIGSGKHDLMFKTPCDEPHPINSSKNVLPTYWLVRDMTWMCVNTDTHCSSWMEKQEKNFSSTTLRINQNRHNNKCLQYQGFSYQALCPLLYKYYLLIITNAQKNIKYLSPWRRLNVYGSLLCLEGIDPKEVSILSWVE